MRPRLVHFNHGAQTVDDREVERNQALPGLEAGV